MRTAIGLLALLLTFAAPAAGQTHLLVVSGLGGEARYSDAFHEWGTTLVDAAVERFGVPRDHVVHLAEDPVRDPSRIDGPSRKEEIERALRGIAGRAGAEDRILIVLFGHGNTDSRGSRLNVPGPNLTAADFAEMLRMFPTQPLAIVNTASASGGFQDALAGPNRVIVTATRSGMERNETIFGRYFVQAFAGDGADADRDGRVSLTEAFEYAVRETERSYSTEGLLQMERGRLEGDPALARAFHLAPIRSGAPEGGSPELTALYERRVRLEEEIEALRGRAGQMDPEGYEDRLEALLLDLARTNRSILEMEGSR